MAEWGQNHGGHYLIGYCVNDKMLKTAVRDDTMKNVTNSLN